MSLMANLYVGSSGLQVSQNALNTTAHNMANIDTEGYTRQQVSQGTRAYQTLEKKNECIAWKQIGTGVNYNNCKQVRSEFLDKSFRKESGRSAFYDVSKKTLEEVEDQLQEMNGTEFAESLNNLWTAVQELAKDPCSAVTQSAMVTRANEFLTRAKSVYDGLTSYQQNLDTTVYDIVKNINKIGDKIKELNEKIVDIESGKQEKANDLRDERNNLLDQLGKYGKIDYSEDIFGNVSVYFEGSSFITTDHVNHIGIDTTLESSVGYATPYWEYAARTEIDKDGDEIVVSIDGAHIYDLTQTISTSTDTDIGKLKSVLLARGDHNATYHDIVESEDYYNSNIAQSVIMNVQAEFDQMIHNIMTAINEVLEEAESNPATIDNTLGTVKDFDLFIVANPEDRVLYDMGKEHPAGSVYTGFTINNTQINPKFLQDPTIFGFRTVEGNEDTATMTKLKEAFTSEKYTLNPNVSTRNSFVTYYNALVSQVANSGDVNNSIAEAQEQTVTAISSAREQIVGVSSDEELEYMIQFQNAFNASSRYINVVSEMLEHLVNTLGS
ncbi:MULTISPECIES: flagellar hook-associated protein FlgK [unclassified Butyrivibrio]|uniref:flagellar hook-associated protein FlgK n=1 Tax=unclassified Butyrivibrio TaxID=2639466 RepID=UPI0008EE8D3C|nr:MULTISPECIES: flagellar hook-associated protein FlgK [unclassified Butyrivibrio]RKM59597.1 flagellar hook-associated protein FlgK [Butyrivibrio sp. XB500-5]SFU66345.1 flagellar hook-associated protein 1 FlgK [Butyrivibrio sp. INlla21]